MASEKTKKKIQPAQYILLSFLFVILTGTCLLCLPISNVGASQSFLDNLFIATSATCVTGLVPFAIGDQFTLFGQLVVIIMIQIGGLGLLTLLLFFAGSIANSKMSIRNKGLLVEALNLKSFAGVKSILRNIIKFTVIVEMIGAVILFTSISRDMELGKAIFTSIFLSISAFCNAGFDNLGSTSLIAYQNDPVLCTTIALLIMIGGLGFTVWFELLGKIVAFVKKKCTWKQLWNTLSLHTKLVVSLTTALLGLGMGIVLVLEWNNPQTIGNMNLVNKLVNAFFTSSTLRTAGFATIDFAGYTPAIHLIMLAFMFIGGSPGGTAGGIKTTAFATLMFGTWSFLQGQKKLNIFKREISYEYVKSSLCIFTGAACLAFGGTFILLVTEDFTFMETLFEVISALATVGLTLGITGSLSSVGKIVIIVLMYVGRVGVLTLLTYFMRRNDAYAENEIAYPQANILIG